MSLLQGIMCIFLACSAPQSTSVASATLSTFEPDKAQYALRGDPSFSEHRLSAEQRKWYDRLWGAIHNPDQYPNATKMAKSGDLYLYRGDLQDYSNSLLTVFRLTGDLRLLDEVSRVSELMREELKDAWHGTRDGKDGTKDGFLNWVDLYDTDKRFRGKDTQMAYDLKANAHVALFAWAFENNRDLRSPGGYDYGEQADFWKDYLINDFEAKWRKRNDKSKGLPFAEWSGFHTYHSFMKWHYYMGKLTGNSAYSKEAKRMASVLWKEFKEAPSEFGPAWVWPRNLNSLTTRSDLNYLMPQHYARYIVQEAVDLYFEDFDRYADEATMQMFANSLAGFVIIDSDFDVFSRDIGGGEQRVGLPASNKDWGRMDPQRFAISSWSFLAAWDANSGKLITNAAENVYKTVEGDSDMPKRVFIPSGMFLKEMLRG